MPEMVGVTLDEQAGVARAIKKLAERRFTKFEKDMDEIIARTYYDEEDFKKVKDLKKETDEYTDKYEEIITYSESCYAGKPGKKKKEIKEIVKKLSGDHREEIFCKKESQRGKWGNRSSKK